LRSDNLDSVGELYTEDDFRQLVVAVEATPTFLGGLGEPCDGGRLPMSEYLFAQLVLSTSAYF
jgi:hypothetical protein